MRAFIESALVGGEDGTLFSDIYLRNNDDGNFVVNDASKDELDANRPIQYITVYSGQVVDGITITYQLANGKSTVIKHGSGADPSRTTSLITLADGDEIAAVFGRAGYQKYYSRTLVSQLGFFIHNEKTGATRIEGPFGSSSDGSPFHFGDVIAFGGFAQDANALGLSGLTFFKNLGGN